MYKRTKEDQALASRKHRLKKKYGMTEQEYVKLLHKQGGVCAICFKPPCDELLCVDHNHETGKVRGLLHRSCNAAIGLLKEDIDNLESAIRYLKKNS